MKNGYISSNSPTPIKNLDRETIKRRPDTTWKMTAEELAEYNARLKGKKQNNALYNDHKEEQ